MTKKKQSEEARSDIHRIEREMFLSTITEIKNKNKGAKFVLILDNETTPILGSMFTVTELMENHITMIEKYSLVRQPLRNYHAIYLLSPRTVEAGDSAGDGREDLKILRSDIDKGLYLAPHLLLTYESQEALEALARIPKIVEKLQTLKILFIQYKCVDPWTFHTNTPAAFNSMYSDAPSVSFQKCCDDMISGLVSFFFSIQARPRVAFAKNPDKVGIFAAQFEDRMDRVMGELDKDTAKNFDTKDTVLVILSRGNDAIAPLLHQFTYEANTYDTIEVVDQVVIPDPSHKDEKVTLDWFQDQLFQKVRFIQMMDIANTLEEALAPFKELEALQTKGETQAIRSDATKKIARRKTERDQAAGHMTNASNITTQNNARHLVDLSSYEQSIAVGFADGKKFKTNGMELTGKLSVSGPTDEDKVRVLALFNMKVKMFSEAELGRLLQGTSVNPVWKPAVMAIQRLSDDKFKRTDDRVLEGALLTDKYQPLVYEIGKKLSSKDKIEDMEKPKDIGTCRRIVFFIMGGVTYMELRWIDTLRKSDEMRSRKIYVGGSNMMDPLAYLNGLKQL